MKFTLPFWYFMGYIANLFLIIVEYVEKMEDDNSF